MLRPSLRGAEGEEAIQKTGSQQATQSIKTGLLRSCLGFASQSLAMTGEIVYFLSKNGFFPVALSGRPRACRTSLLKNFRSRPALPTEYIMRLSM